MITAGMNPEILMVEDSAVEAEILRRCLDRAGYRVIVAKNGEEGLKAAREHRPALVVSDIQMPMMDGYRMCREIKYDEHLWSVPVILLTVLSEPEDIMQAINCGADSYIIKPFVESSLLERISALLATPIHSKRSDERRSEQVEYNGNPYTVTGGSQQILNLLLSVYENTLAQNRDLARIQTQLNLLNDGLDEQVRERTAELFLEKKKLERVNQALRVLSACNVALVHAMSEEELFQNICRNIVWLGEHLFAGVFFQGSEPECIPSLVSSYGGDNIRQILIELQQDVDYRRRCPIVAAQVMRETKVCSRGVDSEEYGLEKLFNVGVESGLALPLMNHNFLGVLVVFSSNPEAFDADEIKLMEELASDLAYGISTLRTRVERDGAVIRELHSSVELRHVLEQTIAAIALTLEKRDPYAAGHQQRVAKLATAIATEMGLPQKKVDGILFGSLLHNIGTVGVPAEILNRPARLNDLQFALVKQHAQTGFDIVKDIHFPWPVAQMVYQHHERMDGSGYPQGLKGEQIILEARILAVADVLEAMIAYRPYRPAISMNDAINKLSEGRCTLFDPAVVDACVRVVKIQA